MREQKSVVNYRSIYDHSGISIYLEKMARKGWLLEKIGNYFWKFRKIDPQELKFSVTYFPPASVWDPAPSEQEETFREYCEDAGWKLAASNAQLQVFYTESQDTVPLETDAVLQVETVHKAMKKSVLAGSWMMGILGLLYTAFWFVTFLENPVFVLTDYANWFRFIAYVNLLLLCFVELVTYYRWHKKAVKVAEETGNLHPSKSHPVFQQISMIVVISSLLAWFASSTSKRMSIIMAASLLNMTVLILAVNGCRILLKKLQVSGGTNKIITIAVDVVLAFLLMGVLTSAIMRVDIQEKEPVDTYEHYGIERYVYNDPLPLTVEDLIAVDPAGYSKEQTVQETILAAKYDCVQKARRDWDIQQPDMDYYLVICKEPALTNFCWNGWIEDYKEGPHIYGTLEPMNASAWNAQEAYYVSDGREQGGQWLICWEDRFLRLTVDWNLTEQQMEIIGEQILYYEE